MNNNRGSRKGIGVSRNELDVIRDYFRRFGVTFTEATKQVGKDDDPVYSAIGRRKVVMLQFETTSLYFGANGGDYLGREYMARDECDYFTVRYGESA